MLSGIINPADLKRASWLCETCVPDNAKENDRESEQPVWTSQCKRYTLWIDGVGAWHICVGDQVEIGGPALNHAEADICLMANISRRHARLVRDGEDWFIHARHPTVVSGRTAGEKAALRTGDEIRLGERVRLGFRVPSPLATTAVIDFESDHRPAQSVNGIVLMTDNCLLGPRRDYHIFCPEWPDLLVLFTRDGQLCCRSNMPLKLNQTIVRDVAELSHGSVVSGEEFRFRVECLDG